MKITYLALLTFSLAISTYAQTAAEITNPPNITVLKNKWRFQVRNPAMDESSFTAIDERFRAQQDTRDNIQQDARERVQQDTATSDAENRRRIKIRARPVKPPAAPPTQKSSDNASAAYIYEVKVKNTSEKVISRLTLDYIFFEPDTKQEIGRRRFVSTKVIAPSKTKNLVFRSVAPPTGTIDAKRAGKEFSEKFFEQVIIQKVENSDGTVWQNNLKN